MNHIAKAAKFCTLALTLATCATLAAAPPAAPPPTPPKPPAPASYSGCVLKDPGSPDLVISTPTTCARLTGDAASADKLAGHQVDLTGLFTPRTSSASASIQVNSVDKVGKACSEVCSLGPPALAACSGPATRPSPAAWAERPEK